jgi:hypothetical protein
VFCVFCGSIFFLIARTSDAPFGRPWIIRRDFVRHADAAVATAGRHSCVVRLEIPGPLDQYNVMWEPAQITFDLVDDMTTDPVVTVTVRTPAGVLKLMAEPERVGRTLVLHGLHLQDLSPNAIGAANLIVLAHVVMQRMDIDELVVEGGLRTTGANPGRRPRVLRFSRRVRAAADRPPPP